MIELPRACAARRRDRAERGVLLLRHQRSDADHLRHQPRRRRELSRHLPGARHPAERSVRVDRPRGRGRTDAHRRRARPQDAAEAQGRHLRRARRRPGLGRILPRDRASTTSRARRSACRSRASPPPRPRSARRRRERRDEKTKRSRQRHVRRQQRGRGSCADRFPRATAKGGGLCRGRGGRGQSPVRLGRQAGHLDRGRDVAVSPLRRHRRRVAIHRLPHHRHPAAALRARRFRADAELPVVSAVGAVPQSHPLVGHRRRCHGRRDPGLRHRGRRGIHRPRDHADAARRRARGRLHHLVARGDAPHHRLDRSVRCAVVHRLCHGRSLSAAAMDAPRLRHFAARRPPVHHARGHFRHSGRRVVLADHPVHDLRRVPAAFRRRQILHRLFDGAHGPQGQQRRPHGGAVIFPARRPVRLRRRHHGDDRRRRLSSDAEGGLREERGRRPARRGRPRRHHLAAGPGRRRLPDRRVPQDQLPRRDLDGGHPDLPLLPVAPVHGGTRCQAVRRANRGRPPGIDARGR